jgi:hypothetical protein
MQMACRKHPEKRELHGNTGLCDKCAAVKGSELYDKQNGKCAICDDPLGERDPKGQVPSSAQLDHDYKSGKIRDVLCKKCNLGLGHFDDDTKRLRDAADYLDRWNKMTIE